MNGDNCGDMEAQSMAQAFTNPQPPAGKAMTKIGVVVFDDIWVANGTTVRARRVLELLSGNYDITIVSCSKSRGSLERVGLANVRLINIQYVGMRLLMSRSLPIPVKLIPIVLWNLRLALVLLRTRFHIVYLVNDWFGFLSAYLVSKVKGYDTIFEAHAIYSAESKELGHSGLRLKLERALERFVVSHSDFVIALSQNTFEFYQQFTSRIGLVPVFVDTQLFTAGKRPERTERKLIGLIGPFDAGSVRQRSSLEFVYARIGEFDSRIDFVVIGRCDDRVENRRIRYAGYLDSLGDYVGELSRLDAVLLAEGAATFGPLNKIIEAMSCSVPVFTTPKGMVGLSWVEPGRHILVFEEAELVDKVNELIFDAERMREIGRNARNVVEQYYSKKANAQKLISILHSMASD